MIRCRFCERAFETLPEDAIIIRVKPTFVMIQFQDTGKSVHQFSRTDLVNPKPHIEEPEMIVIPPLAQALDTPIEVKQSEPRTPQPAPWPWVA